MSDTPPPSDPPVLSAKEKAAARQAKLRTASAARLAKITANAEGRVVNDSSIGITPTQTPKTEGPPPPSTIGQAIAMDDDPEEIDIGALAAPPSLRSTGAPGGIGAASPFAPGTSDPFAALAGMAGMGGPFGGAQGGAGGGAGGDPFAAMMQQMMGGAGGGMGRGAGGPGAGGGGLPQPPVHPFPPTPKSTLEKLFPLVHLVSMVGLVLYFVAVFEPEKRGLGGGLDWRRWSGLMWGQEVGLAGAPLLWAFVTLELVLQSTRIFLFRNRVPPPGILSSLLPMLQTFSPQLALLVNTGTKYISLGNVLLNDISVVIFTVGVVVSVAWWKEGALDGKAVEQVWEGVQKTEL